MEGKFISSLCFIFHAKSEIPRGYREAADLEDKYCETEKHGEWHADIDEGGGNANTPVLGIRRFDLGERDYGNVVLASQNLSRVKARIYASSKCRATCREMRPDCAIPISLKRRNFPATRDWETIVIACLAKSVLKIWPVCRSVYAVKVDETAHHPHEHQDGPEDKDGFAIRPAKLI
jgi:hypothetical protein